MVTVRLSEPPSLSVDTNLPANPLAARRSMFSPEYTPTKAMAEPVQEEDEENEQDEQENPTSAEEGTRLTASAGDGPKNLMEELQESTEDDERREAAPSAETHESTDESDTEEDVDWDELQKTEAAHAQDQAKDDNSTAMLLARLEEENNKIATNPKGVKVKVVEQVTTRRPRPPSMAQLRDMVTGPTPVALRYSVLPPPPMTDLEFYMALVKDYQQTAARLPTLLANKIRKGIPPPLRGVVWQSMAGARDSMLLEQFERLSGESSPYEGIIGKDLGRSFPGVDMFRDPDGDGQRMLGRVLKCFSLYDQKIGYCQGLAFLVGPLLMHMPDNQAFCVLVRLMEHYDLRACFLPDLSGLHVRIYQFRELLRQHLPTVSAHLDELQVDPAYVSQWFLSFFAVTCPLPMLFRIYDVIFAEGASETIMRVALSLMRKNSSRIVACQEMEDVMQLLLSRGLWDCYHYNADEFVEDFVGLSNVVSREKLAQLELNYREAQIATANATRSSDVATAASRFLGRLWTSSPKSTLGSLSPGFIAPSRPLSMLRRSTSKQSLASTLNSMETSSASVLSTTSTDATTISRDSSTADDSSIRESTPIASKQSLLNSNVTENRALHTQIEDLLTALSDLQRNHALLATQLQKEREERDEERMAVKSLLDGLKKTEPGSEERKENIPNELSQLIEGVHERFGAQQNDRNSQGPSIVETKSQLRDELARTKEHLMNEVSKSQGLNRRIDELGQEAQSLKEQLRESHAHVRNMHQEKQRLGKQVHTMRVRASADPHQGTAASESAGWFSSAVNSAAGGHGGGGPAGGLRELKLSRSKSTPNSQVPFAGRSASLQRIQMEPHSVPNSSQSASEHEALLMELVQAKTAEAVARQEADEYKQKLETLRKSCGIASVEAPGTTPASTAASTAMGVLGRLAGAVADTSGGGAKSATPAPTAAASGAANNGGGFWGWRR
ncbi:rab-GTPase-TBC domain-containing protein [Pseudomassariella vexata]|uniref:Rab-GTPase-TBC domain-domain-containing protein n=1 Tax=Pseudomassariella vexata TaxID=1141098 RepID=A0A1Y2DV01_9PEZI|nr:rab-GTPase-TBC domain-containing protein [Pseudomassariella vexata]ORY63077.1 rab-GTPase-TBC domain-domain-containing protein [Pseudomassariella vexata]